MQALPSVQRNWCALHILPGLVSLQLASSIPSLQSTWPSHLRAIGRHAGVSKGQKNCINKGKKCDGIYLWLQTFTKICLHNFNYNIHFSFYKVYVTHDIFILSEPVHTAFPHNPIYRTNSNLRHNNFLPILEMHCEEANSLEFWYCRCRYSESSKQLPYIPLYSNFKTIHKVLTPMCWNKHLILPKNKPSEHESEKNIKPQKFNTG